MHVALALAWLTRVAQGAWDEGGTTGQSDDGPPSAGNPAMTADWVVGAVTFDFDCELALAGLSGGRKAGLAVKTDP